MHIVGDGLYHSEKERTENFLERVAKKTENLKKLEVQHTKPSPSHFSSEITDTSTPSSQKVKEELQAEEKEKYGEEWVGKIKTIRIVSENEDSSDDDCSTKVHCHSSYIENETSNDDDDDTDTDSIDDDDDDEDNDNDDDDNNNNDEDPQNKNQTMMLEKEEDTAQVHNECISMPTMQPYYDGIWNEPLLWFQSQFFSQK